MPQKLSLKDNHIADLLMRQQLVNVSNYLNASIKHITLSNSNGQKTNKIVLEFTQEDPLKRFNTLK